MKNLLKLYVEDFEFKAIFKLRKPLQLFNHNNIRKHCSWKIILMRGKTTATQIIRSVPKGGR